ncbi:MAG: hypothetical protein IPI66_07430 [Chitinophagaceae bacterium]|nr:hypothetical protein [Chitinophagaceae bacterium]MBL0057175.1 hypothetical protein [Chitinophagaceae bacterium]
MKNYVSIGGGLLTAISMFLPFISMLGTSVNFMDAKGSVAWFFIGCGLVIAVVGFMGKKMLNILSLLLGLVVAGLALKYQSDAKSLGATVGIGLWVMLGGGALAIIGSVMGLMKKTA